MASTRTPSTAWSELLTAESLNSDGCLDVALPAVSLEKDKPAALSWRLFALRRIAQENTHQGHVSINVKPGASGVKMAVRQLSLQSPQHSRGQKGLDAVCDSARIVRGTCDTQVRLNCATGQLFSPQSWDIETAMRCDHGNDFKYTRNKKSVRNHGGQLISDCSGNVSVKNLPAGALACDWSFLYAISFLELGIGQSLGFTWLQELDKIKTGHKIYRRDNSEIAFGAQKRPVRKFIQLGRGVLPWEYYVDIQTNSLLLAISGLKAFILDTGAASKTFEIVPGLNDAREVL